MESQVLTSLIAYGPFAALFCWLLFDTQKKNETREGKYQDTINKNQEIILELTNKFNIMDDVKKDVEEIKTYVKSGG